MRRSHYSRGVFAALAAFTALPVMLAALSTQGGPLPGPLPLFPPDNWWNTDISTAPVDTASATYISFVGATKGLHPDFGGDVTPGERSSVWLPVCGGRWHADQAGGPVSVRRRKRRREPYNRSEHSVLPDSRRGDHPGPLGGKRRARQRRPSQQQRSPPADRRSNKPLPVRVVQRVLRRQPVAGGIRGFLRHEHERPAAGWLDLGGRGRARHPPGTGPVRRGLRNGRDSTRVSRDRPLDEWIRLSGVPSGRLHERRVAHGRAAAPESQPRRVGFYAGGPAHLPRDEALRADRCRQRVGHVHQRDVRARVGTTAYSIPRSAR